MKLRSALTIVISATLLFSQITHSEAAQIAQGKSCSKINVKSVVKSATYTCIKVKGKLVWSAPTAVKTTVPAPSGPSTPAFTPTPATTQTTSPTNCTGSAWVCSGWKFRSESDVIAQSTSAFNAYIKTERSPNQAVNVLAQNGVDPQLVSWVTKGANLVAHSFAYPPLSGPFTDVLAVDADWLATTYATTGISQQEIDGKVGAFKAGAPAFGGTINNTWNWSAIQRDNLMVRDKAGMAQTAGHEFFHAIQERLAGKNPGADGIEIPNWFWEGPAVFIGLNSASSIGALDYKAEGIQAFKDRYSNGDSINRTSDLEAIKANDGKVDPYAIGFAATEFLVANVGVEKFVNIYGALSKGQSFAEAFEGATGVKLADFYAMFADVRDGLGFAKQ